MRTELPRQKGQEQGAVRGPSAIAEFWSSPPTRAATRREEAGRDLGRDPGRPDPHDGPEALFLGGPEGLRVWQGIRPMVTRDAWVRAGQDG